MSEENNSTPLVLRHDISTPEHATSEWIFVLTRLYEQLLMLLAALLPMLAFGYIALFQDSTLLFHDHTAHEVAILAAILQSSFITFVTWRCYLSSGEPLLRWLTLSLLGFTLIYGLHGVFTRLSDHHMALFLLYGPVSRCVMAACLLAGILSFGKDHHPPEERTRKEFWLRWITFFVSIDILVAWLTLSVPEIIQPVRLAIEGFAMLLLLAGAALIYLRHRRSWMMQIYIFALIYLVQGSLVFIIAKPWDHLWWLAHLIGAAGFTILSYGVVRAFHTTRAFSLVFSQEEVLKQLAAAKEHAEHLTTQLQEANATLEIQASTDPLTGLSNRRHFMELCNLEVARAQRSGGKITMLALDLDHFKQINDRYGHAMGDEVLKTFAERASSELRPTDRLARLGGEEFMVLLPDTAIPEALLIAERIRSKVEQIRVTTPAAIISFTVSIGLAEFPTHGERLEQVFIRADECLYRAKAQGRNQIAHPL